MNLILYLFIFVFGLIFGSFLTSLTWRLVENKPISKGRSICPNCKKTIQWYDNIPLISYGFLKGKCRYCKKAISIRYPLIELACGLGFVVIFHLYNYCANTLQGVSSQGHIVCEYQNYLGIVSLPYYFAIFLILFAILIIDWEHQIIPDELTFAFLILTYLPIMLLPFPDLYLRLLTGFIAAFVLLMIALATKGAGMGLGDVKFAIPVGTFLGWPFFIYWLYLSFLTGGIVGIILILTGKSSFKSKIAFGPFLVISLFIIIVFSKYVKGLFFL